MAEKVTIHELEKILDEAPGSVRLNPDGSVTAGKCLTCESLRAEVERLKVVFWRNPKNFEQVPCGICGYNGPNYYQPSTHPCAVEYHRRRNENQTPK